METMTTQSATTASQPEVSIQQKPDKRKGGRPRLLPEQRRRNPLTICYTDAELERLEERADAAGLSNTQLIHRLSLNLEIKTIPQANREAIIELNRLGRNVSQVAKKLSMGMVSGFTQENVTPWMNAISQTIEAVGKRLTGEQDGHK